MRILFLILMISIVLYGCTIEIKGMDVFRYDENTENDTRIHKRNLYRSEKKSGGLFSRHPQDLFKEELMAEILGQPD